MSASTLIDMSSPLTQLTELLAQEQTLQAQQAVVAQISTEAGGGAAPIVSSSVTAPGALELFA